MQNIFEIPTVNESLPVEIDQAWVDRINAAFPVPYVNTDEINATNHPEIEQARKRNLLVGRELRRNMIQRVRFLDDAGAALLLASTDRVERLRDNGESIAVRDHDTWLYPVFQFNPKTNLPYPVVARIEKFFKKEINGWGEISWWVSANIHLNRRAPYEYLTPEREIELMLFLDENRLRLS